MGSPKSYSNFTFCSVDSFDVCVSEEYFFGNFDTRIKPFLLTDTWYSEQGFIVVQIGCS